MHERAGREIVADEMAAKFAIRFFPASERCRRGRKRGIDAKIVEKAIGVQTVQVRADGFLSIKKGPRQKPNLRKLERLKLGFYGLPVENQGAVEWTVVC